jgi:putative transposase
VATFWPNVRSRDPERRIEAIKSSRWQWHLDEVFVNIDGERHYMLRAVDHEGEVLESFLTKKRDKNAALKFLGKALRRHDRTEKITTDKLRSYGAALNQIGAQGFQNTERCVNNRIENSHLPFRRCERAMLRFRRMRNLQMFASVHASVVNYFNHEHSLAS